MMLTVDLNTVGPQAVKQNVLHWHIVDSQSWSANHTL
jgi:hypothetical protein